MWLQNWQFSQRAQNLYLGGNTFVVSGKYNHDFCWDSTVMILLLTEKPPWVLFGWTKIAQSGSEALQECDKIWPSGSEAFSSSSESSIFFTSCSSSLIYSPLYSRPCFLWSHCSFGASSSPGLLLLYYYCFSTFYSCFSCFSQHFCFSLFSHWTSRSSFTVLLLLAP